MTQLFKDLLIAPAIAVGPDSVQIDVGNAPVPGSAAVTIARVARPLRMAQCRLVNFQVSVAAASDFGSLKLLDLPTDRALVVGTSVNLTTVPVGFASDVGTAVHLALGTVATASTTFLNAGEDNLCPDLTGTGAGSPGAVNGGSGATETNVLLAAGAKSIFVNVADPVTAGTGTLTLNGIITVFYLDLD